MAIQHDVLKDNVDNKGVIMKQWSPEMLTLFKQTWDEVSAEEAANDEFFAKVLADMTQFRDGYQLWKENAFLPRK